MKKITGTILVLLFAFFLFLYVVPAFSGERVVNSNIFLGPVRIHLYGLSLALAFLASWYVAFQVAGRFGIQKKDLDQSLLWIVVSGFLGARLYFVLFQWQYFSEHPGQIVAFWQGGISIYGALIGGALGIYLFTKLKGFPFYRFLDIAALVAPLGQAIGRWGNFFNQEAFGAPTDLPWGLHISPAFRPQQFLETQSFHPTFLYESVWNLLVFLILLFVSAKSPKAGTVAIYYLILYGTARFFIEGLRLDSVFIGSVRADQMVSVLAVSLGAGWLLFNYSKNKGASSNI